MKLIPFAIQILMASAGPAFSWINETHLKIGHRLQSHKQQELYFRRATRKTLINRLAINRLLQKLDLVGKTDPIEKNVRKHAFKSRDNIRRRRFHINT